MTDLLCKGGLTARMTRFSKDLERAQDLRGLCFHGQGRDADDLDAACDHVLIEDSQGQLISTFRMQRLSGADISQSYSAQFYDLAALRGFAGPMVEIGRFCIHPDHVRSPDILRVAWGALTAYVDREGIALLFGCSSFVGTDAAAYADCFARLKEHHLAPAKWQPRKKAPDVIEFSGHLDGGADSRRGLRSMPPLLRTYLMMGGWVSDHAVVDVKMNTLHVFTGLEIDAIPPARKWALRAVAG